MATEFDKRLTDYDTSCAGHGCNANVDPVMEGDVCAACVGRIGVIRYGANAATVSAGDAAWWVLTRGNIEHRRARGAPCAGPK